MGRVIDLDAPIIPGQSAAGVHLGSSTDSLIQNVEPEQSQMLSGQVIRLVLGAVSAWSTNGIIRQIGVSEGYRGHLANGVRIGVTIAEVESCCGSSVRENEWDSLIVDGSPGWCFETEQWDRDGNGIEIGGLVENRHKRIVEIFVFGIRSAAPEN
jgi:hypothetical protein